MADFSKVIIPALDGEDEVLDVRKQLGNALYYRSQDLKGSELGKRIYFSEGEIKIDDAEKELVKGMCEQVFGSYVVRQAVINSL